MTYFTKQVTREIVSWKTQIQPFPRDSGCCTVDNILKL